MIPGEYVLGDGEIVANQGRRLRCDARVHDRIGQERDASPGCDEPTATGS